ncbi:MAG TPA: hypothetical protein VJZ27_14805, partial [Aggregatilineales bacterium]|nr:hypothetical protein [Aggregatilineales bacterium]
MEDHLAHADYEILLNGRRLTNYEQYQLPLRRESDSRWYVYWYYPVGELEPGRYEISYLVTWDEQINDGYTDFGPGTENESDEGKCVFSVVE